MAEAKAELVLRVEDGQLSHMHSHDPAEVWETLERVHRAAGFATSLSLRCSFLSAKKTKDQPMQAWISQIQNLVFRMEAASITVSEQDRILALTMGLPTNCLQCRYHQFQLSTARFANAEPRHHTLAEQRDPPGRRKDKLGR